MFYHNDYDDRYKQDKDYHQDDDHGHKKEKHHRDRHDYDDRKKRDHNHEHDCKYKKDWDDDSDCGYKKEKDTHNCVCKTVREIHDAQQEAARSKHGCDVSCQKSIKELLHHSKNSDLDTIPFKLLCGCKGDCETFVGTGVVKIHGCFYDIRSSFFRVVDFVKDSKCCAILELLCPERCKHKKHGIKGFVRTGACFEVDLKDFTGITCFPPVKTQKMDPKKLLGDRKN